MACRGGADRRGNLERAVAIINGNANCFYLRAAAAAGPPAPPRNLLRARNSGRGRRAPAPSAPIKIACKFFLIAGQCKT